MRAAFHDAADVKVVGIEKAGDRDAEEILRAEGLAEDSSQELITYRVESSRFNVQNDIL